MTIKTQTTAGVARFNIFASPVGPRIMLDKPNDGGADEAAAKAAADAAAKDAADKAAADKAAADEAAKKAALSDKEAELLKENMKKKDEIKALKEQLTKFEGIDPEQVKKLLADAAAAEEAKKAAELAAAQAAGDTEKVKKMMAEAHQAEIEAERKKIAEKDGEVQTAKTALDNALKVINELTVGTAFSNSSFVKDELILTPAKARVVYGDHFESENGVVVAYDKPKGVEGRTKLIDGSGQALGFEAAIKKLVDSDPERDNLVKSKMAPGAGSKTSGAKPEAPKTELKGIARIQAALAAQKQK